MLGEVHKTVVKRALAEVSDTPAAKHSLDVVAGQGFNHPYILSCDYPRFPPGLLALHPCVQVIGPLPGFKFTTDVVLGGEVLVANL